MTNKKIGIATALISLYATFVLINALVYYFLLLPGETNLSRGLVRAIGSFVIAYYVYKRNKPAYWVAFMGSCLLAVLGILATILLSTSTDGSLSVFINLIPVALLLPVFFLLFPKEVRAEFK